MSKLPIAIGNRKAQKRFIERNTLFLLEHPRLHELAEKVFLRSLEPPDKEEGKRLRQLSKDDPSVVAFENKTMADRVIFYLGRMAIDDFGEIVTLAGNGHGFGAYKIVRGMYERVVTALYMEKNPAEARQFIESSAISKLNYLKRTFAGIPESRERFSDESMHAIESDASAAHARRKQSTCSKCRQPVTQEAWTRVSLDAMAKSVEPALAVLYPQFYLEGTAQSHANMFGMERRLVRRRDGFTYKDASEDEAQFALHLGHHLMVLLLSMQSKYFGLGLEEQVQERLRAFKAVWVGNPANSPASS
jgi:hypothetical protein